MGFKIKSGIWPTMIIPFTADNKVDFSAIPRMVDWYCANGCDGIFTVCQSSEMFFLSAREKLDIARCVVEEAQGRLQVIASGHTQKELNAQIDELGCMVETGVDAVVLVSNRLASEEEDEATFAKNADKIFASLPHATFGMYECPYPYKRLLSIDFISHCARSGQMVFLKDTCCDTTTIEARAKASAGTELALFNANSATLLSSLKLGYCGYSGVMANFHPAIYKTLFSRFKTDPDIAEVISSFITLSGAIEVRAYPISAKYHMNALGVAMGLYTRSRDVGVFDENARLEIDSLIEMEKLVAKHIATMVANALKEEVREV